MGFENCVIIHNKFRNKIYIYDICKHKKAKIKKVGKKYVIKN